MSNVLSEEKKQQVVALGRLGWALRRIEEATGVRRETASGYLKAAGVVVGGPGRRPERSKPAIVSEVSTDPGQPSGSNPAISAGVSTDFSGMNRPARSPSSSACEPYREVIEEALSRGRNAVAIYQDLVDGHGFRSGYSSVKRYVVKLRGKKPVEARVVIATDPGVEAQADYGEGPMCRYPKTGKYRRTRLFMMTLGYSRKSVRLLTWQSSTELWARLHEEAFRRLGGTVRVVVLDNLREGVLKPDIYDPALNPLYADVMRHYGVTALPCRVGDPDRKGKVESGVGHTQKTPLRGMRFDDIEEGQAYLDRWDERWGDTRIHGTTKRQVLQMFAEEKPHLGPLPLEPFRYYRYGERVVHLDGCVEVAAAYYGAPPGWIGQKVRVQWDELHVRLLSPKTGELLREHLRGKRGWHRIEERDRPARTPRGTELLLRRARSAGEHIGAVCRHVYANEGPSSTRKILGVLALCRKYGPEAVDAAAMEAFEVGLPTYRFLRRQLERRPKAPVSLRQIDPLIRQLTLYRDLIDQKTGDHT